jgi:putative hydrolase of the HAD superfamily
MQAPKIFFPHLRHAAVSSAPPAWLQENLETAGISNAFEKTISPLPGMPHKPAPDVYLHALREMGATPETALAFEDSGPGVTAATEAGIPCVALPNSFTARNDFSRASLIIPPDAVRHPQRILAALGHH